MVTHWESSKRSLFVKTVWKNGQHHVLLQKEEDEVVETSNSPAKRKTATSDTRKNNKRTSQSAVNLPTASNLKISSVKLLLSGIKGIKDSQKLKRCKTTQSDFSNSWTTVEVVPSVQVNYKEFNRDVSFTKVKLQQKIGVMPVKFGSVDAEAEVDYNFGPEDYNLREVKPVACNYPDQYNLSERVLTWLDLATQNGNYCNSFVRGKIPHQRVVTAQACAISPKKKPNIMKNYSGNNKIYENLRFCDSPINDEADEIVENKRVEIVNQSILKNDHSNKVNFASGEMVANKPHLLSRVEDDFVVEERQGEKSKNRVSTAKRQLHIFMPNLPKKFSECDSSILSSKSSSLRKSLITEK